MKPELICPAGTPASLRTAIDCGADAVYCGFQNETNARNFPGLNFTPDEMAEAINYAHSKSAKVLLAANTFPPAGKFHIWKDAVDAAIQMGIDAIIVADIGVAQYIHENHPKQRIHLSVQASAASADAIKYYCQNFDVKRVVLPRILTIAEITEIKSEIPCEIECFIFGNHGLMEEGRCSLTNYATGLSTNMDGVCSPAGHVQYSEDSKKNLRTKLGDFTIDCFSCGQKPGYPTICKGRYNVAHRDDSYYAFEEPISLNLASLLPQLINAGVHAFKIEGRQRSRAYIREVVSSWRAAIDAVLAKKEADISHLRSLTEGHKQTQGAYESKKWR